MRKTPKQFMAFITQLFGGKVDGLYGMSRMREKLVALSGENSKLLGVVGYVELMSGDIVYVESKDKNVTKRSIGILVNEIYKNDLETAKSINEDICDSLDFRRETIEEGIKVGREKAEEVLHA